MGTVIVNDQVLVSNIRLKALIEGQYEMPVVAFRVGSNPNMPDTADVVIPPTDTVLKLQPRSMVQVFYDETGRAVKDEDWLLAFNGEYLSMSFQDGRNGRACTLRCAGLYHLMTTTYVYQRTTAVDDPDFLMDYSIIEGGMDVNTINQQSVKQETNDITSSYIPGGSGTNPAKISYENPTADVMGKWDPKTQPLPPPVVNIQVQDAAGNPVVPKHMSGETYPTTHTLSPSYEVYVPLLERTIVKEWKQTIHKSDFGDIKFATNNDTLNDLQNSLKLIPTTYSKYVPEIEQVLNGLAESDYAPVYTGQIEFNYLSTLIETGSVSYSESKVGPYDFSSVIKTYEGKTQPSDWYSGGTRSNEQDRGNISFAKSSPILNKGYVVIDGVANDTKDGSGKFIKFKDSDKTYSDFQDSWEWGMSIFIKILVSKPEADKALSDLYDETIMKSRLEKLGQVDVYAFTCDSNTNSARRVVNNYYEYPFFIVAKNWMNLVRQYFKPYVDMMIQSAGSAATNPVGVQSFYTGGPESIKGSVLGLMNDAFTYGEQSKRGMPGAMDYFFHGLFLGNYINTHKQYEYFRTRVLNNIEGVSPDPFMSTLYKTQYLISIVTNQIPALKGGIVPLQEVFQYTMGKVYYSFIPNPVAGILGNTIQSLLFMPWLYFYPPPQCNDLDQTDYYEFNFSKHSLTEITRLGAAINTLTTLEGTSSVPFSTVLLPKIIAPTSIFGSATGGPDVEKLRKIQPHERITGILPDWMKMDDLASTAANIAGLENAAGGLRAKLSPGSSGKYDTRFASEFSSKFTTERSITTAILIHYTGGWGDPSGVVSSLKKEEYGIHFIVDTKGNIFECVPSQIRTSHAGGTKGLVRPNSFAIGIEVINGGGRKPSEGPWPKMENLNLAERGPLTGTIPTGIKEYRGFQYFPYYTDAQYKALAIIIKDMCTKYNIDPVFHHTERQYVAFEKNKNVTTKWRGIISHEDMQSNKQDVGPAFDWNKLYQMVQG